MIQRAIPCIEELKKPMSTQVGISLKKLSVKIVLMHTSNNLQVSKKNVSDNHNLCSAKALQRGDLTIFHFYGGHLSNCRFYHGTYKFATENSRHTLFLPILLMWHTK